MNTALLLALIFLPLVASVTLYPIGKRAGARGYTVKSTALILVTLTELALTAILLFVGRGTSLSLGNGALIPLMLSFDGLPALYATVTAFMWFGAALLSVHYFKHHGLSDRYAFFFLFTEGATLGVFLSSHLLTTFVFFEMMSLASYCWVVEEETDGARRAGKTYLTIAVIGGMVTLMGLFLLHHITGTLELSALKELCTATESRTELYAAAFCILIGFGAKAGMFPVHIWLPKAHPVAPAPASALLSGVLTKTGILGILVVTENLLPHDHFWGMLLLTLGAITMLLGAILAVFSVNLKRTLACSSLSQIGFILVGVSMIALLGEENALAAHGTVLYMMNHSIVKLVLFLSAGAIYALSHTLDLNELRGFGRKRPLLAAVFLVGGMSLAGIPGTLGYLSKTLVHESIVEYAAHSGNPYVTAVEWLFLLSGGLTAAYVTKLFVTIFVMKPQNAAYADPARPRLPVLSWIALLIGIVPILLFGFTPHLLAEPIAASCLAFVGGHEMHHAVHYLAWVNLKGVVISLSIATIVYLVVVRLLLTSKDKAGVRFHVDRLPERYSMENVVYVPLGKLLTYLMTLVARILSEGLDVIAKLFFRFYRVLLHVFSDIPDLIVLTTRRTVLRPTNPPTPRPRYALCILFGSWIDRTFHKNDKEANTPELLIRTAKTLNTITSKIAGNFSFALLMACLGILAILVTLVFLFY